MQGVDLHEQPRKSIVLRNEHEFEGGYQGRDTVAGTASFGLTFSTFTSRQLAPRNSGRRRMSAITTKKLLVSFDPSNPDGRGGGFVVPAIAGERVCFLDLQSNRQSDFAMMVFIGREVAANDLFAKLVETGRQIESVEETFQVLSQFVGSLGSFRIGNVVSIESAQQDAGGFRLVKVAETPSAAARMLR